MTDWDSITVVIPARDAAATLGECLDALAIEGVPGPGRELIVVDDGSTDATACLAARPGVRILHGAGHGPAAARNLGTREAHGDIVIFLDADTAPCPGWLSEMLAPLADRDVVAVKGRYYTRQRSPVARFAQLEFEEKYDRLARAACVDFVDTGTAAFRRDPLLAVGGFDEGFPSQSAEDVELGFRLARHGARLAFNPRAAVWHHHAEHLDEYLTKKARYGYFRLQVYSRFPEKALGDAYTPPTMGLQIGLTGLAGAALPLALLRVPGARLAVKVALGLFGATTWPLVRRAACSGQADLVALVPPLVFARAFAQGLGITASLPRVFARRLRGPRGAA